MGRAGYGGPAASQVVRVGSVGVGELFGNGDREFGRGLGLTRIAGPGVREATRRFDPGLETPPPGSVRTCLEQHGQGGLGTAECLQDVGCRTGPGGDFGECQMSLSSKVTVLVDRTNGCLSLPFPQECVQGGGPCVDASPVRAASLANSMARRKSFKSLPGYSFRVIPMDSSLVAARSNWPVSLSTPAR